MYENFNASSSESLDSIFTRLQKIVSQLAILGENISQEDLNFKFLRSLPSIWRNKPDLGSISFDDLYNNFKIVEQEVKRSVISSSNSSSQNVAFVSTPGSTNDVNTSNVHVSTASSSLSTASTTDNTARLSDATIYAFLANQPNGSQVVHEDLEQIHEDDLEEMDLKWQLAITNVECFNCHKMGHFVRECRNPRSQDYKSRNQDSSRKTMNVEESSSKSMLAIDGVGFDWSFMTEEKTPTNFALMAFSDSKVNKSVSENSSNEIKKTSSAPIIEDWISDCDEDETLEKVSESANVQKPKQADQPRKISQNPRNNSTNWNTPMSKKLGVGFQFTLKACFVCGSFNHLIKDYDFHDNKMVQKPILNNVKNGAGQREVRPVWNNAMRTNHQNFSNSRRNFAPTTVLTKSGLVPISTARQSSSRAATSVSTVRPIKTVAPKTFVNVAKTRPNAFQKLHSPSRRPFYQQTALKNITLNNKVNTVKVGDEAVHKELGDRMERAATTASSFKTEQDSDAQTRFEAASKSPMIHLSQEVTHLEVGRTGRMSKTKYGDVETGHAEEESSEVYLINVVLAVVMASCIASLINCFVASSIRVDAIVIFDSNDRLLVLYIDDEDYTVVFDKNSFSYKIISTNDLKTDSENDNEKVTPSLPSPEPTKVEAEVDDAKEAEELKQCLEIVLDDGDDVTIDATPLADEKTQMYLTFSKMLKNFDREDLEVLWRIVKAIFKKTEPVNYMNTFLHLNLKTMFEHHVEDSIWKNQQRLVKVLNWMLFDSCGVHFVIVQTIPYYLLVEKMYPLIKNTLHQMFNNVKLQVYYESEMAYELLRLVKKQLKEGYVPE
ncbi:ribonuclease H-like domain-containing protein [Tanacetum coccineum]